MNRQQLLDFHHKMANDAVELMKLKNNDYAGNEGNAPFANFTRVEAMGICSTERGFMVRLLDKMSRLSTYCESGQLLVKDEGVYDTCIDIMNYAVLMAAYLQAKKDSNPAHDEVALQR